MLIKPPVRDGSRGVRATLELPESLKQRLPAVFGRVAKRGVFKPSRDLRCLKVAGQNLTIRSISRLSHS